MKNGEALFTVVGLAIIVLSALVWADFIYGDWTCAFAECRKVK